MKHLITHLKAEWYKYLLEIIVITVGILGAFILNSWNEQRKQQAIELEILEGCKAELETDLVDINLNIRLHGNAIRSINQILNTIDADLPYQDSLAYDFGYAMIYTYFVHSTSAFEVMKSQGIDIITNEKIRNDIIKLYDANYNFFIKIEEDLVQVVRYGYKEIFPARFEEAFKIDVSDSNFSNPIVPVDFESLKKDNEFLYYFKSLRNETQFLLDGHYASLKNNVEALIKELEKEIDRKK
jgi:hypothetical protein